jgi:hypothetical protein
MTTFGLSRRFQQKLNDPGYEGILEKSTLHAWVIGTLRKMYLLLDPDYVTVRRNVIGARDPVALEKARRATNTEIYCFILSPLPEEGPNLEIHKDQPYERQKMACFEMARLLD